MSAGGGVVSKPNGGTVNADETYNGWKNYPTWCVNLWLGNDEGLYNEATAKAEYAVTYTDDHPNVSAEIWTTEETRRFTLADDLKGWVRDELAPDLGASFGADLLGYALDQVDWNEIADAWLETASETVDAV
jgi:hypothetical protein